MSYRNKGPEVEQEAVLQSANKSCVMDYSYCVRTGRIVALRIERCGGIKAAQFGVETNTVLIGTF